jgi:hypothetical protein
MYYNGENMAPALLKTLTQISYDVVCELLVKFEKLILERQCFQDMLTT